LSTLITYSPKLIGEINNKIVAISECLSGNLPKDIDLIGGKAGIALFWAYYSRFSKSVDLEKKLSPIISEIFQGIRQSYISPTFAGGLAGIGWMIEHLNQNDFIEIDTDSILDSFDEALYPVMLKMMTTGDYDYLHGALGIGLYYLNRKSNPKSALYITELVNELDKHTEHFPHGFTWESRLLREEDEMIYNLSLSHGIASIISVLSSFYEANIDCERISNLVNGAINFLLTNKNDIKLSKYFFPSYIYKNHDYKENLGRLAWCYNDLGISMALLKAAMIFNNEHWKQEAINVLLHTTNIIKWNDTKVEDAGLCHGCTGIAHIYHRSYRYTGIEKFKDSAIYWFNQSLKMADFKDGLAGYKCVKPKKYGGICDEYGFLEGIAGIGLAMISAVSDIEPEWDNALLLN